MCMSHWSAYRRHASFRLSFHILMNPSFDAVTNTQWSSIKKLSTPFTLQSNNNVVSAPMLKSHHMTWKMFEGISQFTWFHVLWTHRAISLLPNHTTAQIHHLLQRLTWNSENKQKPKTFKFNFFQWNDKNMFNTKFLDVFFCQSITEIKRTHV